MVKQVTIFCDSCGKDITLAGSKPTFRLRLEAEKVPHATGLIKAVLVRPPIKHDKHFCSLSHLADWLKERGASNAKLPRG